MNVYEKEINKIIYQLLIAPGFPIDRNIWGPEDIKPSHRLVDDLMADSLDQLEIIMACEELSDIYLSDEEACNIRTVSDLYKTFIHRDK